MQLLPPVKIVALEESLIFPIQLQRCQEFTLHLRHRLPIRNPIIGWNIPQVPISNFLSLGQLAFDMSFTKQMKLNACFSQMYISPVLRGRGRRFDAVPPVTRSCCPKRRSSSSEGSRFQALPWWSVWSGYRLRITKGEPSHSSMTIQQSMSFNTFCICSDAHLRSALIWTTLLIMTIFLLNYCSIVGSPFTFLVLYLMIPPTLIKWWVY